MMLSETLNDKNKHGILLPKTLTDRNREFVQSFSLKYQSYWKDLSTVLCVSLDFIIINSVLTLFVIINDKWKRECCTGRICHTFVKFNNFGIGSSADNYKVMLICHEKLQIYSDMCVYLY